MIKTHSHVVAGAADTCSPIRAKLQKTGFYLWNKIAMLF
jgi:hypothetical protein